MTVSRVLRNITWAVVTICDKRRYKLYTRSKTMPYTFSVNYGVFAVNKLN